MNALLIAAAVATTGVTWAGAAPGEGNRFGPVPLPVAGLVSFLGIAALIVRCVTP